MKSNITIIALLILSISTIGYSQTKWDPVSFPDTLLIRSLNAEKEGVLITCTGRQQGDYKGVFRSYDNGETWEELIVDTTAASHIYGTVNRDNDQVLYLGSRGRVYRSFDDGNSFEKILDVIGNIFTINFNDNNDIYVGGWCGVLRSTDDGVTWDTICNGSIRYFSDIDFGINGEIYIVGRDFSSGSGGGGFYRSLDNGLTWENTYIWDGSYSIAVNNSGIINVDGYLISYDSGETWTINNIYYATDIESNQYEELVASCGSGVLLSQDWGESWSDISINLLGRYVDQVSISPTGFTYLVIDNDYNKIFCSRDPVIINPHESIENNINIYPNPSSDYFIVKPKNRKSLKLIGVYNYLGQRITNVILNNEVINMTNQNNGIYTIILKLDDQIIIKKIIRK